MIMEPTMIPGIGMMSLQDWTYSNWKEKELLKLKVLHTFTKKDIENIVRQWLFEAGKLKGPLSVELKFSWNRIGNILDVRESQQDV